MLAEARRNPNAGVTNLLILVEGGKEPFFKKAPMTEGGTSEEDKFRDPTLLDPETDKEKRKSQPPMEVSDKEVALVRRRFEEHHGMTLPEIIAELTEAGMQSDLEEFLVRETRL